MKRWIVGYYCPKAGGHLDLIGDPDAEFVCGSHYAPVIVETDRPQSQWIPYTEGAGQREHPPK